MTALDARDRAIDALHATRPRSSFLRGSATALVVLAAVSWATGEFSLAETFSARRLENLHRFLHEIVPHPLQGRTFDPGAALSFAGDLLAKDGLRALGITLAISIVAITLAGLAAALGAPFAARTLATAEPFLPAGRAPHAAVRVAWRALAVVVRFGLMFVRAIPEYVWAFLLLAMIGPTAWPAVIALALHNAGILGRLDAEILENVTPRSPTALRGLGASRAQITAAALVPASIGRAMSFFFYRFETCVREATVLGLLGIVSLGYEVLEARAANRYDEMLFYVLLGAVLVGAGDLVSHRLRHWIRR